MAIEDRKGRNVIDIRHLRELFDVRSMVKMYDKFYVLIPIQTLVHSGLCT